MSNSDATVAFSTQSPSVATKRMSSRSRSSAIHSVWDSKMSGPRDAHRSPESVLHV